MAYKCVQNTNIKIKNNLKMVLKLILTNKQFKKKCSIIYKILILLGDVICFYLSKNFSFVPYKTTTKIRVLWVYTKFINLKFQKHAI